MLGQAHHQPHQRRFDFARRTLPGELEAPRGGWLRREEAILGTAITVELWADDARSGAAACAAVMDEMHRIDRQTSVQRSSSELSRINREAAHHAVALSEEMFALVARAVEFSRLSRGAFDISSAAVDRLVDDRCGARPGAVELARAQAAVGWQHLRLDARARTLRFGRPGMSIDFGSFARGHAADRAATLLRRRGIRHALVSAGGDSRVIGDRRGRPWSVAISDPRRTGEALSVLPLEDVSVSTAGSDERGHDERGTDGLTRVTVLAADGLTSAALSKAVRVLGAARGLALIESLAGVRAVAVDAAGRLHASSGLLDGTAARHARNERALGAMGAAATVAS